MHVSTHHHTSATANAQAAHWRMFFRIGLRVLAVGLFASGIVTWIAANWEGLGKFERIAGVQGLLVLTVLVALVLAWRGRRGQMPSAGVAGVPAFAGALFLASVVTGGLLALLGQTYQTGADPWTLFAWWALLMLPWLWAARSWFVIVLWLVVVNTAVVLLLGERSLVSADSHSLAGDAWTLVVINVILLALAECLRSRYSDPYRVVPRLLTLAILVALFGTLAAYIEFIARHRLNSDMFLQVVFVAATVAAGFYVYRRVRKDVFILSQLAVFTVLYAGSYVLVVSWLFAESIELSVVLAFVVGLVGLLGCVSWLRRIHRVQPEQPRFAAGAGSRSGASENETGVTAAKVHATTEATETTTSTATNPAVPDTGTAGDIPEPARQWPLLFLFSFGFLFLLAVALILLLEIEWVVAGGVCVAAGLLVYFILGARRRVIGATLILAGVLLMAFRVSDYPYFGLPFPLPALGLVAGLMVLYHMYRATWYQFLCAAAAIVLLADVWLQYASGLYRFESGDSLPGFLSGPAPVFLVLATLIMMSLPRVWASQYKTLAWALLCVPLAASFIYMYGDSYGQPQVQAGGQTMLALALQKWRLPTPFPQLYISHLVFALLPVIVAWLSARRRRVPWPDQAVVLIVLLGVGALWGHLPGVQLGLLLCVLGYELRYQSMLAVGIISIIVFLAQFYYQLSFLLLDKSHFLMGQGVVLLLVALVWHWAGSELPASAAEPGVSDAASVLGHESVYPLSRHTVVMTAMLVGLVAVLAAANVDVMRKEAIIRDGTRFVVALRPVDPRSLMQGDYMTLNFVTRGGDEADVFSDYSHHYVELTPDAQGVYQFRRTLPDLAAAEQTDNVMVRYRRRMDGQVLFVTDAYFFPEGRGEHFARARYGEFRVDRDGTALLVGLLDEQQNRL